MSDGAVIDDMPANRLTRLVRRRAGPVAAVVLVHAVLAYLVLSGLAIELAQRATGALALYDVTPPVAAPLEPLAPEGDLADEEEAAASAASLDAIPVPIVAPPPVVVLPEPPPLPAAPAPSEGIESAAGASEIDKGGTGAGGEGDGLGSGLAGSGRGGGGVVRAKLVSGAIRNADYPKEAGRDGARIGGSVTAHFDIDSYGRPRNCRVVGSSGNAALDATTCRLIEARFRYRPARNARGEPVPDVAGWRQDWWLERG